MKKNKLTRVGSEEQYGPRLVGEILHGYLENSNEPLAVAYREHTADVETKGWHPDTHLCVNLKTILRGDRYAKAGKSYTGVLRRDVTCEEFNYDEHFTFVETASQTAEKRNPHVFVGRYITITRRDDGSLRPNFKPMPTGDGFSVERYALGVYNELCMALIGLVGKE